MTEELSPYVIPTYTGRLIDPCRMDVWDIDYRDVAHALSQTNRYMGHSVKAYSVAEHCVIMHDYLEAKGHNKSTCVHGLFHDACETYVGDMAAPLKKSMRDRLGSKAMDEIQRRVDRLCTIRLKIDTVQLGLQQIDLDAIDEVDKRMCIYEARACFPHTYTHPIWEHKFGPIDPSEIPLLTPQLLSPEVAKWSFVTRLQEYLDPKPQPQNWTYP